MYDNFLEANASNTSLDAPAASGAHLDQQQLLRSLWASGKLNHFIATLKGGVFKAEPVSDVEEALKLADGYCANGFDVFFAPAEFMTPEGRKADNAAGARALWLDIDCGEKKAEQGKGYATTEDALVALDEFRRKVCLPEPTYVVRSGGGLHVYWMMRNLLDAETWTATARRLKELTKVCGYLADQTKTADKAALLRIPGTLNYKYPVPRPVTLVRSGSPLEPAAVVELIDAAHARLMPAAPIKTVTAGDDRVQREIESEPADLSSVSLLVYQIRPDVGYEDWLRVLMAIFHETQGSEEGLRLAIDWSRRGKKFKGEDDVISHWRSFRLDVATPVTIGSLHIMARDLGEEFDVVEYPVVEAPPSKVPKTVVTAAVAPDASKPAIAPALARYTLLGMAAQIEQEMVDDVPILGKLAVLGQATVFFAAPNTGKTLITLHLLVEDIKRGVIDPSQLYYVNVDDSGRGLTEKLHVADELGFNTLVNGRCGFKTANLMGHLEEMTADETAKGAIVVLDTLTKFVDTMDKTRSRQFSDVCRGFVVAGGTVIALAHVNKKADPDGKPMYAGTTDIRDNFDCAYIMWASKDQPDPELRVVELESIKGRSCSVPERAWYSYVKGTVGSYTERLMTVAAYDYADLLAFKREQEAVADAVLIETVKACIAEGINQKVTLCGEVATRRGVSKRDAIQLVEKYTGTDPLTAHWCFEVKARGAKVFRLLDQLIAAL